MKKSLSMGSFIAKDDELEDEELIWLEKYGNALYNEERQDDEDD